MFFLRECALHKEARRRRRRLRARGGFDARVRTYPFISPGKLRVERAKYRRVHVRPRSRLSLEAWTLGTRGADFRFASVKPAQRYRLGETILFFPRKTINN
jgi:hypothetical protein